MSAAKFGISGIVQNLPDGRVKVIAEDGRADLDRFAEALKIRNAIIDVTDVAKEYSRVSGDFEDFHNLVGEEEIDEKLDKSAEYLKELIDVIRDGFSRMDDGFARIEGSLVRMEGDLAGLGNKMDLMIGKQDIMIDKQDKMLDKQDKMLDKQDKMLDKQDTTIDETREMRYYLKSYMESRFWRIESEISEIKRVLRQRKLNRTLPVG
jgi:acylphosphatase